MRKTKIVCTIGPASEDESILRQLILGGMNVARINFSHGTHEEHLAKIKRIKKLREELDLPVALLLDTKGPEIRTGSFAEGTVELKAGQKFRIHSTPLEGTTEQMSVTYSQFHNDLHPGDHILIDDGLVELIVDAIVDQVVYCTVLNGGPVSDRKGVNLPNISTSLPALTEQDIIDLEFGVSHGVDFIAASFVRKAIDILEIRKVLHRFGGENINIIAKIENQEGINNFDEILKVADGIMVARGDLGVEIPMERVPTVQKNLIQQCYRVGKPCITATQMLDSMIRNPRPTRAEVSDVANAIHDGTSAVMLSGETAAGKYPLISLQTISRIAETTENSINYWDSFNYNRAEAQPSVTNAISHAACTTAMDLKAAAIVVVTYGGRTARLVSAFRPDCPIVATTVSPTSQRQLNLSWGVTPFLVPEADTTDEIFDNAIQKTVENNIVAKGETVVLAGGTPIGMSGTANTLKVQSVGYILVRGRGMGKGVLTAEALVLDHTFSPDDAVPANRGYILVAERTDNSCIPFIRNAGAVIVEDDDPGSHTTAACLALDIPLLYGAENATRIIKTGSALTIDVERGTVS